MMSGKRIKERLTSEERRSQILDIALGLFAEKGFNGTRTREIADAAGISETLIFQHFESKEELYNAALRELHSPHPMKPEVEKQMAERDDFGVFKTIALHIITHGRQDRRAIRLSIFSALEGTHLAEIIRKREETEPDTQFLAEYIQKRVDEGAFKGINAKITARLFAEALEMFLVAEEARIAGPLLPFSDEDTIDTLVKILLYGLVQETH